MLWLDRSAMTLASVLPSSVKQAAKRYLIPRSHPAHLGLRRLGTVQDLYYWVADGRLDTLLPLHNYFSVFYPDLETATTGSLTIYDADGIERDRQPVVLAHLGAQLLRLSSFVRIAPFGTLCVELAIPPAVQAQLIAPCYFWDRFAIGYLTQAGQPTFVHGIDKTFICAAESRLRAYWYPPRRTYGWALEMPLNILDYVCCSVIVLNRVSRPAQITLRVTDLDHRSLAMEASIPPCGVHRFLLTPALLAGLVPTELRMQLDGLPTPYGRPLLLKEFPNGAISALHG